MPTSKQIKELNAEVAHGLTDKLIVQQTDPSPYDTHAIYSKDLFTQAMVNGVGTLTEGTVPAHQMRIRKDDNTFLDVTVLSTGEITLVPNVAGDETGAGFTLKSAASQGNTVGFLQVQKNDGTVALSVDNDNSRVGIAKAAPTVALDVAGIGLFTHSAGVGIQITNTGSGDSLNINAGTANDFVVDAAGNVGIGIDPANALSILDTASPQVRISYDEDGYATLGVIDDGHLQIQTYQNNSNITLATTGTNGSIVLNSSGTGDITLVSTDDMALTAADLMSITSSTEGISISATTAAKQVLIAGGNTDTGGIRLNADATTTQEGVVVSLDGLTTGIGMLVESDANNTSVREILYVLQDRATATGATAFYVKQDSTAPTAHFETTGNDTTINATGVGINQDTPVLPLHVKSSGSGARGYGAIYLESDDAASATGGPYIMFDHGGNPRAYILGTGGTSFNNAALEFGVGDPVSASIVSGGNGVLTIARVGEGQTVTKGRVSISSGVADTTPDATLHVNSDENIPGIEIVSDATTSNPLKITADSLTSGDGVYIFSDSDSNTARSLVNIVSESNDATNTSCLELRNDGPTANGSASDANLIVGYGRVASSLVEFMRVDSYGRAHFGATTSDAINADFVISSGWSEGGGEHDSTVLRLSEYSDADSNWDFTAWDSHATGTAYNHCLSIGRSASSAAATDYFWLKDDGDGRISGNFQIGEGSSTEDGVVSYRTEDAVLSIYGRIEGEWVDLGAAGGVGSGDITGVTITTDSGGGSAASDTGGSADFSLLGGATGIDVTNSGATITVDLDLSEITAGVVAHGDSFVFVDADDSNANKQESIADLATLLAGSGLTATDSVIAVDGTWTNITIDGDRNITPGDGSMIHLDTSTLTDNATSGSGIAAKFASAAFEGPTLAATNSSVTTTNAATVYVSGPPIAGANQTLTNTWALWVDSGNAKFDGAVTAASFVGPLTGDASGSSGSCTGNSATATLASTATVTGDSISNTDFPVAFHNGSNALLDDTGVFHYNPSTGTATAVEFVGGGSGLTGVSTATVTLVATNTSIATHYPVFVDTATGSENPRTDTGFTYVPTSGTLTSLAFSGDGSALTNISTATMTVADTDEAACFVGLWEAASGALAPKSDASLLYNASTGSLQATIFDTSVAAAGVTLAGTTLSADGTDTNISVTVTPKGTGSVVMSKVDINAGAIDGTAVGAASASTGEFTGLRASSLFAANVGGTVGTFTDGDATPSVATGNLWQHHASEQTITMFDDGVAGQTIHVVSTAAITYDVTSTNLKGGSANIVTASGDITSWFFDGTNWNLLQFMDLSADHSTIGGSGSGATALDGLSDVAYSSGDLTITSLDTIVAAGDLALDVGGDIELNADGGDIVLKDASVEVARFFHLPASTLDGAVSGSATSVTITDASNFPSSGTITIAAEGGNSAETVAYSAKSGNDLTTAALANAHGDDAGVTENEFGLKMTGELIYSDDGGKMLHLDAPSSPVNYFQFKTSNTGNEVELNAKGNDANIDFSITPKGTGSLLLDSKIRINANSISTASGSIVLDPAGSVYVNSSASNSDFAVNGQGIDNLLHVDASDQSVKIADGTGGLKVLGDSTFEGTAQFNDNLICGADGDTSTVVMFFTDDSGNYLKFNGASDSTLELIGEVDLRSQCTIESTSTTTGSIQTDGGVGIAKNLYVGGAMSYQCAEGSISSETHNISTSARIVLIDTAGGAGDVTVQLPAAVIGRVLEVYKICPSSTTFNVDIVPGGSATINGGSSVEISTAGQYEGYRLICTSSGTSGTWLAHYQQIDADSGMGP